MDKHHCCGDEGTEPEGTVLNLPVNLHSNSHLWSRDMVTDRANKMVDTSSQQAVAFVGWLGSVLQIWWAAQTS